MQRVVKPKVLFYAYEYPPLGGGVGNAVAALVEEWARGGEVEMEVVVSGVEGKERIEQVGKGVRINWLAMRAREERELQSQRVSDMVWYCWRAGWYTWKLVGERQFDLSHCFGYPGGLVSWVWGWKMPYVISLRGVEVPGYNERFGGWYGLYGKMAKVVWRGAARVVANSEGLMTMAENVAPGLKMQVIENGVDSEIFRPVREKDKYKRFTVTAGGTIMGKRKGLEYLVEGFGRLWRENKEVRLVLMGSGDEEVNLKDKVRELGIEEAVEFVGRRDRVWIAKKLPRCQVLCLPSVNEGMSNAVLEGMAAGLPVVVTDVGGTRELVKGNGLVIEKRSSEAVYRALRELYGSEKKRRRMGRVSRRLVEKKSWKRVAEQYGELYRYVVRERGRK